MMVIKSSTKTSKTWYKDHLKTVCITKTSHVNIISYIFLYLLGSHYEDSENAFSLSKLSKNFYCTIGVFPLDSADLKDESVLKKVFDNLERKIEKYGKQVMAVGICGLDYTILDEVDRET